MVGNISRARHAEDLVFHNQILVGLKGYGFLQRDILIRHFIFCLMAHPFLWDVGSPVYGDILEGVRFLNRNPEMVSWLGLKDLN